MSTTPPSPDEIKKNIAALFDTVADGYDNPSARFFTFCADKMLDILQPKKNTRLLDIATGTGAVATSAAQMLLPEGRVHAIDLSEKMLNRTFKNSQKMSLSNIDLHVMDAQKPIFKSDYFHNITCSFGIFFIPDMSDALHNWLRILQPGGKLIFSTFSTDAFSPLIELFKNRMALYGVDVPTETWLRVSEPDQCQDLLQRAGYTEIKTEQKQLGYHLLNIDDWWEILWNTGYRGFLNQLDASDLTKFRAEHLKDLEQYKTEDGLWLNIQTLFSTAKRPL